MGVGVSGFDRFATCGFVFKRMRVNVVLVSRFASCGFSIGDCRNRAFRLLFLCIIYRGRK